MRLSALPTLVPDAESFLEHPPLEPVVWRGSATAVRFGLDEVGELLDHGSLGGPMVSQVLQGQRQPYAAYTWGGRPTQPGFREVVRSAAVATNVAKGATTVLEALHRTWRPIGDLCRRLSHETGVPWSANAFLTPQGSQGFKHHHDTHPVLIVQTSGSKTWQLHRPVLTDPLEHQPFIDAEVSEQDWARLREQTPHLEVELHPGDTLWIPRGWIHNGFATDEHSLHVSFAYPALTPYWVAQELFARLADLPEFRAELPWGQARSATARAAALELTAKLVADHLADLGQTALDRAGDALAQTARSYHLEAVRAPFAEMRHDLAVTTPVRTVAESAIAREWTAAGELVVHLGDSRARFEAGGASVVALLLEDDAPGSWTPADLITDDRMAPHLADEAAALRLTADLLATGLARRVA